MDPVCVTEGVAVTCGPGHRIAEVQAIWAIGKAVALVQSAAPWFTVAAFVSAVVVIAAGVVVGRLLTAVK